jgi:hypothetical protein
VSTTQVFPEANTFVVENGSAGVTRGAHAAGSSRCRRALALFIWILFGRKEEEGGGAFAKRLQAYGRRGGGQVEEKKGFLDRLPLLRRFSQAAEEQVAQRGLTSGVNSALEQANIPLAPGEAIMAAFGIAVIAGLFGWLYKRPIGRSDLLRHRHPLVFGLINWAGKPGEAKFEKPASRHSDPDVDLAPGRVLAAPGSRGGGRRGARSNRPGVRSGHRRGPAGSSVTEALNGITERTQSRTSSGR